MAKSAYVMLAHPFNPNKHQIRSQYISDKLDGMRAIWDGGISRGKPAKEVPWCNSEKHDRFKTPPIATGLWSRYGQPIQAPDWWLNQLPTDLLLDGELWMGNGLFQETVSIVQTKSNDNGSDWEKVKFKVIDSPSVWSFLQTRTISEINIKLKILDSATSWYWSQNYTEPKFPNPTAFNDVYKDLYPYIPPPSHGIFHLHPQTILPDNEAEARDYAERYAKQVVMEGGEGAVIRYRWSYWNPVRSYDLLKVKPSSDMEGTVVGYYFGERTEKGSKLLGMMGSLIVRLDNGKEFSLSGFTDAERALSGTDPSTSGSDACNVAISNPGAKAPYWIQAEQFPRGTRITFTYRTFSRDGIPREARYLRKRPLGV